MSWICCDSAPWRRDARRRAAANWWWPRRPAISRPQISDWRKTRIAEFRTPCNSSSRSSWNWARPVRSCYGFWNTAWNCRLSTRGVKCTGYVRHTATSIRFWPTRRMPVPMHTDLTDPENRLVADELERRWNEALRRLQDIEQRIDQHNRQQAALVRPTKEHFERLANDLETVWNSPN